MPDSVSSQKAANFANIILSLRQRFNDEEVDFLKQTQCLSFVQFKVLLMIASNQPCTMGEVSKQIPSLSLSSITVIVDKLVKTDFVTRVRCDEDRRVVRVKLTDTGQRFYKSYHEAMVRMSERMLACIDEDEQDFLLKIYKKFSHMC
jgi:DNA-binding MarR family transcriptional regulator